MVEKSTNILFVQTSIECLVQELSNPLSQISVIYPNKSFLQEKNRWISSVTLWSKNQVGLRITPNVNEVCDEGEVGSLSFERIEHADIRDEFFQLGDSYANNTLLQKIVLNESGVRIEAGIRIIAQDNTEILIVPNVMPLTLAIRCEEIVQQYFEPEFPLDCYVVENWTPKKDTQ